MTVSRSIALMLAALAVTGVGVAAPAFKSWAADSKPAAPAAAPAKAGEPVYREFIQGNPKSKVTVIEYASLTCGHCKAFQDDIYPELKKAYIDTGKIRFVYRDFPLDGLAAGGALLARCAPGDKGKVLIDLMFKNQAEWVRSPSPLEPLKGYAQLAGMDNAAVEACLKNEGIMNKIREVQETASNQYKVQSTPTFFINEEKLEGAQPFEAMSKVIDKAIANAK
ncbi:MAG: DsbA family protein [Rhodospirillaceae bacterium]|nr:DsbA family protein [Rhodospirillaceae bacterium]